MKASEFYRSVFRCNDFDCGFIFGLLGAQAKFEIEGQCPACGGDIDYAPVPAVEKYIKELKDELQYVETDIQPKPIVLEEPERRGVTIRNLLNWFSTIDHRQQFTFSNGVYLNGKYASYRGHYEDLALDFSTVDEGYNTSGKLVSLLFDALNDGVMQGCKGGEYPITMDTFVWLAHEGTVADAERLRGVSISYAYPDPFNVIKTPTINVGEKEI